MCGGGFVKPVAQRCLGASRKRLALPILVRLFNPFKAGTY